MYSFSWSFESIVAGFVVIGFFNAGITTFYQNNIPVEIMGRVTRIYQLIQSGIQVVSILVIGFIADIVSLRITIITLAMMMLIASIVLMFVIMQPNKQVCYEGKNMWVKNKEEGKWISIIEILSGIFYLHQVKKIIIKEREKESHYRKNMWKRIFSKTSRKRLKTLDIYLLGSNCKR